MGELVGDAATRIWRLFFSLWCNQFENVLREETMYSIDREEQDFVLNAYIDRKTVDASLRRQ